MRAHILASAAAAALLCGTVPALADDPPARVGRLADLSGAVSLRTDPNQPWAVATRNQPVTSGMSFWTEPQARAALEIGPTELHIGDRTELDIQQLDDQTFAAQLDQGSVNIDIADLQAGETYTVDTPRGTVTLERPGEYRIDAGTTQDPTQVVVFSGEAQIAGGPDGPVDIQGGETGIVSGTDPFSYNLAQSADRSPLDDWADGRLRAASAAPRYVSRAMTGYQDLDAAGTWHEAPSYGTVWYPNDVPADWVPYRYGRWEYEDRWGWTWVDDQPWGFAPFHYGRWAYIDNRWGWVPGPVEARPVYAPALVTFFAGAAVGAAITAAVDSHPIGWYPLGPGEVYRPPYRVSDTYVRNVNVTNIRNVEINRINTVTNIHNGPTIIENAANRRFATVVPAQVLAARQPVAHAALQVRPEQLENAKLTPVADLPHPVAAAAASQPPAPHPAAVAARGPNGRLPLAAADPNRPRPPAPSKPAVPIDQARAAQGRTPGQPPVQHGPAAPAPGQPGQPTAPTGAAQAQPGRPPLPERNQHEPNAPGGPAAPQTGAAPQGQPSHPPLPERNQRNPNEPGGSAAPQTGAAPQGQPGHPPLPERNRRGPNAPGGPAAPQTSPMPQAQRPPLPESGQRPTGVPNAAQAPSPARTLAERPKPQPQAAPRPPVAAQPHAAEVRPSAPRNAPAAPRPEPRIVQQPQPHAAPPPRPAPQAHPAPQAEHRPPQAPGRPVIPPPNKRQQDQQQD